MSQPQGDWPVYRLISAMLFSYHFTKWNIVLPTHRPELREHTIQGGILWKAEGKGQVGKAMLNTVLADTEIKANETIAKWKPWKRARC